MSPIEKLVEDLLASLCRACDVFREPILQDLEEGTKVYYRLEETLTPELKRLTRTLIQRYVREQHWKAHDFITTRKFIAFTLSPAPPKPHRASRRTPE